jgi:hypothetical protein
VDKRSAGVGRTPLQERLSNRALQPHGHSGRVTFQIEFEESFEDRVIVEVRWPAVGV